MSIKKESYISNFNLKIIKKYKLFKYSLIINFIHDIIFQLIFGNKEITIKLY